MVFGIGIIDDVISVSSKTKFIVLILASILAYFDGFVVDNLGTYFGYTIPLAGFIALPFTVFAITGFTNALNLIDGKDGLASSVSISILIVHVYIGYHYDDFLILSSALLLITVLGTFLIFNWYPAQVFMGDSGSLFIGFIIAMLSIHSLQYIDVTTVLFIAGLPILDTIIVMMRRRQRGISMFTPDKNHTHHILFDMKQNVEFTVIFLMRIQLAFSLIAIQILSGDDIFNILLFLNMFLLFFAIFDPRFKARGEEYKVLTDNHRDRYRNIHKEKGK
jgi:UDP-GlcNAc:undecaprenyl-phosphate GlcNAc-1-phosphate transferase